MDTDPLTAAALLSLREAFYQRKAQDRLRLSDVAERMGTSVPYVSAVLNGKKPISLRTVALFAEAMGYRPVLTLEPAGRRALDQGGDRG